MILHLRNGSASPLLKVGNNKIFSLSISPTHQNFLSTFPLSFMIYFFSGGKKLLGA